MSEETPRDSAPEALAGAREPEEALLKSHLTPPPAVPRPRASGAAPPRPTSTRAGASTPASTSSQFPPPAPMPRVPGMDAFMAAPVVAAAPSSVAKASSPPSALSTEETDVGWATPAPTPAIPAPLDSSDALSSSSNDPIAAARRKSRRTVNGSDESSAIKAPLSAESVERISRPAPIAAPPAARAQSSSSTWLDGFPTEAPAPKEAPLAPVIKASVPAASVAILDTSNDVIQPMRIISIGTDTSPLPQEEASAPRAPGNLVVEEVEAFDAVEDDEPDTMPTVARPARASTARAPLESDAIEEIDLERISDVSVPTSEASASGPHSAGPISLPSSAGPKKPPPPPPPKLRTSIEPVAPPATPPPVVATFSAVAPLAGTPVPATPPSSAAPPAAAGPVSAPPLDPLRKRQKPWWEELFGDDYLRTMDKVDTKVVRKECDFIEDRLGLEKGAVMLDLACGPGAHAVELASRGYSVVGYDLSLAMLARAADEAQDRGQKLNFLQGDMREMAFEDTFDGVYCWQTSFGYFDDEKNVNVLQRIHRSLRKGGMLLLDVINHDYVAPRQPSLVWFEGEGCVCMDEMSVDFFTSRLRVKRTVMFEDGRAREVDYAIRLYALHELGKMLHECGFKVIEVTGHPAHPGVFFGSESPRVIVLAERSEHE